MLTTINLVIFDKNIFCTIHKWSTWWRNLTSHRSAVQWVKVGWILIVKLINMEPHILKNWMLKIGWLLKQVGSFYQCIWVHHRICCFLMMIQLILLLLSSLLPIFHTRHFLAPLNACLSKVLPAKTLSNQLLVISTPAQIKYTSEMWISLQDLSWNFTLRAQQWLIVHKALRYRFVHMQILKHGLLVMDGHCSVAQQEHTPWWISITLLDHMQVELPQGFQDIILDILAVPGWRLQATPSSFPTHPTR